MKTFVISNDQDFQAALAHVSGVGSAAVFEDAIHEKTEATRQIVETVRTGGDAAVQEFTKRFDKVDLAPAEFEVSHEEIERAAATVSGELRATLSRTYDKIRSFHEKHLRSSWEDSLEDGSILGQRITPIESAGAYVPGGTAFYPSSVLMNLAPARVAGVKQIVMVSPPSFEGGIHPVVLAAAQIAKVDRVFRIGGAQAVAALAYGTETIPRVVKITGPGNTYVAVAKRLVQHVCAIDTEAGPSEVTVIADDGADPAYVAGEMLAQAEHDPEACSVVVTTSQDLVDAIQRAIDAELPTLSRAKIIRQSLEMRGAAVIVRDEAEAVRFSNAVAPEHLAIYTRDPRVTLEGIENAGAIMLGGATSVVHGDYVAGPNHILPTGRRARYASPLSAEDFRKVSSVIEFTPQRAKAVAADARRLAEAEELTAHARAAELRE